MNHKILALLMIALGFASPSLAQSARESTEIVQSDETLSGIYGYSQQELEVSGLSDEEAPSVVAESRSHIIRPGETLRMIAERYEVDLTELKMLNDLYGKVVHAGQALLLPLPADSSAAAGEESPAAARKRQHIVQYGDTLGTIAAAYGVKLSELILINGIFGDIIYPGQLLDLPDIEGLTLVNSAASAAGTDPAQPIERDPQLSYIVRAGDTLGELASHFGITRTAIMQANGIVYPHYIAVGQHLWIPATGSAAFNVPTVESAPVADSPTEAAAAAMSEIPPEISEPTGPPPGDYFEHRIQLGETLSALAIHYGLSMQQLMESNRISDPHRIESGQALWIPASAQRRDPPPSPQLPEPVQPPSAEVTTAPVADGERDVYIVQPGDYLSLIGKKLATDWVAMAEINSIVNPDSLRAGMKLLVPNSDDLIKYGSSYSRGGYNLYDNHPGPHVGRGREFVVVLSTQRAYAYEDGVLKKAALVSTGLPATPTVQGDFAIRLKRRSQRMTGPDYDLDNVEWVMYFYQGYAFHGAWWHNNFGQPMSHGCVNMTNADAKWFYDFGSIGTPVHVQYY